MSARIPTWYETIESLPDGMIMTHSIIANAMQAEIDAVRAALASRDKDAERYRQIFDGAPYDVGLAKFRDYDEPIFLNKETADKLLDAAIAAQPSGKEG